MGRERRTNGEIHNGLIKHNFRCDKCNKRYPDQGRLNLHYFSQQHKRATKGEEKSKDQEVITCPFQECEKEYKRLSNYIAHLLSKHGLDYYEDAKEKQEIPKEKQIQKQKEKKKRNPKYKNYFIDTEQKKTFFTEIMNDQQFKNILLLLSERGWVCKPYEEQKQVNIDYIFKCLQFCYEYKSQPKYEEFKNENDPFIFYQELNVTYYPLQLEFLEKNQDTGEEKSDKLERKVPFEINKKLIDSKFTEFIIKMKYLSFYFQSDIKNDLVKIIIFLKFCLVEKINQEDSFRYIQLQFTEINIPIQFLKEINSELNREYTSQGELILKRQQ